MSAIVTRTTERARARPLVSRVRRPFDAVLHGALALACVFVVATALAILAYIAKVGIRGISEVGFANLAFGKTWKPEADSYGGVALVFGTLSTAFGAILLGAIPSIFAALWVNELAPKWVRVVYRRTMEVAIALPSVVYGWLALVYVVPGMDKIAHGIYGADSLASGEGIASSAVLLAVMTAPTISLLALQALERIPAAHRDASAALGASPVQTALRVVLAQSSRGLLLAVFFGFARAAGETMAVQMVIGGARKLPEHLFSPTTTISTQIVMDMQNTRPETTANDVLYSMSLALLLMSTCVVIATRFLSKEKHA